MRLTLRSDWLVSKAHKGKAGVAVPEAVMAETSQRYKQAYHVLTGNTWKDE